MEWLCSGSAHLPERPPRAVRAQRAVPGEADSRAPTFPARLCCDQWPTAAIPSAPWVSVFLFEK